MKFVVFVDFIFQESSDNQKRVIIKAGSYDVERTFNSVPSDVPNSAYYNNSGVGIAQSVISSSVAKLYEKITGNEPDPFAIYDCVITVDGRHKKNRGVASYLWVNKNGEITETPVIYPNDKVEFGVREGVWAFSVLNPFYQVPLGGSSIASYEYQQLFHNIDSHS